MPTDPQPPPPASRPVRSSRRTVTTLGASLVETLVVIAATLGLVAAVRALHGETARAAAEAEHVVDGIVGSAEEGRIPRSSPTAAPPMAAPPTAVLPTAALPTAAPPTAPSPTAPSPTAPSSAASAESRGRAASRVERRLAQAFDPILPFQLWAPSQRPGSEDREPTPYSRLELLEGQSISSKRLQADEYPIKNLGPCPVQLSTGGTVSVGSEFRAPSGSQLRPGSGCGGGTILLVPTPTS